MNTFLAVLQTIQNLFTFLTKVVPDDKIREQNQVLNLPRLQAEQRIALINKEFKRLRNRPSLSIPLDVAFVDSNLSPEDQKELTTIVEQKILDYRKRHPIMFKSWLKAQSIK